MIIRIGDDESALPDSPRCVCHDEPDPPVRARCRHCGRLAGPIPPPHACHARMCNRSVLPSLLMCLPHWRMVPRALQRNVWAHYVKGQEVRKDPTAAYLAAADAAIAAVAKAEGLI